jgi:hypothetical protein
MCGDLFFTPIKKKALIFQGFFLIGGGWWIRTTVGIASRFTGG